MEESPAFLKINQEGRRSPAPLREAFGNWKYLSVSLLVLFGGTVGQAVVWQTTQLYTLFLLGASSLLEGSVYAQPTCPNFAAVAPVSAKVR